MLQTTYNTLPHNHTLENKETKTSTVECKKQVEKSKILHVKNVNKRKNRLTPVKLESKKQDKKVVAERERLGWEVPIDPQDLANSH